MNQKVLTQKLAKSTGLSETETTEIQMAFVEQLLSIVKSGNSLAIQGFGVFELKEKPARKMFNPTKNEYIEIPARQMLGFKASGLLKAKFQ